MAAKPVSILIKMSLYHFPLWVVDQKVSFGFLTDSVLTELWSKTKFNSWHWMWKHEPGNDTTPLIPRVLGSSHQALDKRKWLRIIYRIPQSNGQVRLFLYFNWEWDLINELSLPVKIQAQPRASLSSAQQVLGGILQVILSHFRLSSAGWLLPSALGLVVYCLTVGMATPTRLIWINWFHVINLA